MLDYIVTQSFYTFFYYFAEVAYLSIVPSDTKKVKKEDKFECYSTQEHNYEGKSTLH